MDHHWRERSTEKKDPKQDLVEEEELRAVALSPEKLVRIEREGSYDGERKWLRRRKLTEKGSEGLRYHVKV
jgi:hypothetical protein